MCTTIIFLYRIQWEIHVWNAELEARKIKIDWKIENNIQNICAVLLYLEYLENLHKYNTPCNTLCRDWN